MVLGLVIDVAELGVAVGMLSAFDGPGVGLQAEAFLPQQVPDRVSAHLVSPTGELDREIPGRLRRPAQRRHRIPARIRLDKCQQRGSQTRIHVCGLLPPAAGPTDPPQRFLTGLQLVHALTHRCLTDLSRTRDRPDPAMSQDPGLGPHQQPPLPLLQLREQHLKLHGELVTRLGDTHTTPTSQIAGSNMLILCKPLAEFHAPEWW